MVQIPWGVLTVCETGILLLALSRYSPTVLPPTEVLEGGIVRVERQLVLHKDLYTFSILQFTFTFKSYL
jgi:hypothetical protein